VTGKAVAYAERLLRFAGLDAGAHTAALAALVPAERAPVLDWAASGAMALTGRTDGPPLGAPGAQAANLAGVAAAAAVVARTLPWWSGDDPLAPADAPATLGWRAATLGLRRRGRMSCGGGHRLFTCDDAGVAAGLPRRDDVEMVPAWAGRPVDDPWAAIEDGISRMGAPEAVERAQLLGLPFALVSPPPTPPPAPFRWTDAGRRDRERRPLVVDLTALWAGPLCTLLLARAGARVITAGRRDPMREALPALHEGKEALDLDLHDPELARLLRRADVVVESFRPRVLDDAGLGPDVLLDERPDIVWVSITGYGRNGPTRNRVALGDDAAAAGGIVALTRDTDGAPVFCADAFADPVTGLHAGFAALRALAGDRGGLLDVAMVDVVGHLVGGAAPVTEPARRVGEAWVAVAGDDVEPVAPPRLPRPPRPRR